jgi:hypothetical protein
VKKFSGVSLESLEDLTGMTLGGESLREEEIQRNGEEFQWHADILTHEDHWEIEMMYIFQDQEKEKFNQLQDTPTAYDPKITDSTYYSSIDHQNGETLVLAYIPIQQSLDHEVAEFPAQYLEELRDGFYNQVISGK